MPSSKCFQCDLVSSQLQTSQIKHSPAALPGGPVTHTSNPLPLASSHTEHAARRRNITVFLPRVLRVRGGREGVRHGGGGRGDKPRDTSKYAFCVHKRPAVQGITRFFWRPNFILALGLAGNSFGAPRGSQDRKTRSKDGALAPSVRVARRGV